MAREYNITNIIPKTTPFNFLELDALVEGCSRRTFSAFSVYLLPGHTALGDYCIRSSSEAKQGGRP